MKKKFWFPSRDKIKASPVLADFEFDDFAVQAGILEHTGQKFEYRQLGQGPYKGRLLHAPLGNVSIQIEYTSQSMEKQVEVASDSFTFVMSGNDAPPVGKDPGQEENSDWIQVFSPNAEHVAITPTDCVLTVIRVRKDILLEHSVLLPEVRDWFAGLGRHPVLLTSAWHANRLRSDVHAVLEPLVSNSRPGRGQLLDDTLALSVVLVFNLIWILGRSMCPDEISRTRERFLTVRRLLLETEEDAARLLQNETRHLGSKRLIEQAFADQVTMGPLTYSRVIRLHNARQKLQDQTFREMNIADIAAEEGFWDTSRFTAYYRRQFGELPSETRGKHRR